MAFARQLISVLAVGCITTGVPAAAQVEIPTGSRVGRPAPAKPPTDASLSDEDRALRTTFEYARCVVQNDEDAVRPMLSLKPTSLTERQSEALRQPNCLRNANLQIPMQLMRGAIFRAFYLQDWADRPTTMFAEPINYFEFVASENQAQVAIATMLDFASCIVRADEANARAFVGGIPGEPQFENALRALIPKLGPCMLDGIEVQFSKSNLAAYLSEALYWEAKAAAEAAAAPATAN
ncbi:hypothetical protein [Altericroceibacterium xinjiangense]|uniref:hypothetical protein n=1 Tax=Altericroceibacterium xinjiangense TaxID=762261 RepID=UPI000F7DFE52|nr:hypothetical protein [Altericroceibacterium xinjiangense]